MASELHGVPVSAADSAPPASPKALSSSALSGIRAPLTVDNSDSDYYLSGDDDNVDDAFSGYESDTGSEIADPDDKILEQTQFVNDYVVSKPVVKITDFEIDERSSLDKNLEVVDGVVRTSEDEDGGARLVQSPRVSSGISSIICPEVDKNVVSEAVQKLPGFESDKRGSFGRNAEVFEGGVRTSVGEDENVSLGRLPRVSSGSGISSILGPVGGRHIVSKPVVRIPSFEISRSGSFDRNLGVLSRTPVGENGSLVRSPSVSSGIASIIRPVEENNVDSKPVLKIPGFEIQKRSSFGRNLEVGVGTLAGGKGNASFVRSPRLSVSSGISSIISPGPVEEKFVVSKPVLKTSGLVIEKISSFGRIPGVVDGDVRASVDETESMLHVNSGSPSMVRPIAKVSSGSDDDDDDDGGGGGGGGGGDNDDDDFKSNVKDEPFLGFDGKFSSAPKVRTLDNYASDEESVKDTTLVGDDKGPFDVEESRNVESYEGIQKSDLILERNGGDDGDDWKTCDATGFTDEESIGSNVVEEVQLVPVKDVLEVKVAESREEVSSDYAKCGNAYKDGNGSLESEMEQKTDQVQEINGLLEVEVVESKAEDNLEEASVDCGPSQLDDSEGLKSENELRTDQNLETNDVVEVEVAEGKARDNVEEAFVDYENCGDENVNANGTVLQPCQFVACEEKSDQTLEMAEQFMDNVNFSDTKVFLAGNEIDAGKSTPEEILELEKLQEVVAKFLRLVYRLQKSPEDDRSGTAKILHQILLASGKPCPKSFDFDIARKMASIIEEEGRDDLKNFSLNVLVIGKSGVGKSATINSLFGEEKARTDAFELGTTSVKMIKGNLNGIQIQVFDTPGFSSPLADRKTLSSIKKLIKKMPPDVVLYVDRLDTQVGDINDLPLFNLITAFLGSSIWSRTILTLTHADSCDPSSYDDSFVSKKLHAVQELVRHSRIPVSLVENNLGKEEGKEQKSQLLVLCFAMKLLSDYERNTGYLLREDDYPSVKPLPKQVNDGHILLGISLQNPNSQLSVSLDSRFIGKRRRNGVVCIRLGSSDHRVIAAFAFLPIAKALCRTVFMLHGQQ